MPRLLLCLALVACDGPTRPSSLTCDRMPLYVVAGDTAWVVWSPIQGYPCTLNGQVYGRAG